LTASRAAYSDTIITLPRSFAIGLVVLVLAAGPGCTDSPRDGLPSSATSSAQDAARKTAGELLGALKLVRQEYANAVAPTGGTVVDATEYAETELFAEQAERKLAALRAAGGMPDAAAADALAARLAKIRSDVAAKAPHAAVVDEANAAIATVQQSLAGAVPEAIRGAVLAVDRADQAIAAEAVVGEYRLGVVSGPAQPLFHREGEALVADPGPAAGAVYLAAVVREKRTKRPLPAATVDVVVEGQGGRVESPLREVWGDFHQYGANVTLPSGDGPVTVTVRASSPAYARHGDMLNVFVSPATATLQGHVRGGVLAFDASPVTPTDGDYAVGDDLLQATAEAGDLHNAGPYRVGLIVEGPEPIWLWKDGKPELEPVAADHTNHVEVVLVDRASGQLVPRASIDLTFLKDGAEVGRTTLTPLLSVFSHYGRTLTLPPGTTSVRIHVHPPALGAIGAPRLAEPADIELPLPARRKETA
jgi:hypothetical protein